jgi:hypothetical protein
MKVKIVRNVKRLIAVYIKCKLQFSYSCTVNIAFILVSREVWG